MLYDYMKYKSHDEIRTIRSKFRSIVKCQLELMFHRGLTVNDILELMAEIMGEKGKPYERKAAISNKD